MLVSILVPVYGVERFIEQCAVSLFEQTYKEIEYIFVDDCSKDASIDILKDVIRRYPHRAGSVKIIRHDTNSGVGAARSTALANATGLYVMHADSDDRLPKDAVTLLAAKAEETGADMIDGGYAETADEKVVARHTPYKGNRDGYLKTVLCQNIVSNRLWGRLYRRKLITDHGIDFVKGVDYCEDYSFIARVLFHSQRAVIDEVTYYYRTDNQTSYTHRPSIKNLTSMLHSEAIVYNYFKQHDSERKFAFALQTGMINAVREMYSGGLDMGVLNKFCNYRPDGLLFRMLAKMFSRKSTFRLANTIYLAVRRLYTASL